jgi:hypothetical protein
LKAVLPRFSDIDLLGCSEHFINLDSETANHALDLRVAQQKPREERGSTPLREMVVDRLADLLGDLEANRLVRSSQPAKLVPRRH